MLKIPTIEDFINGRSQLERDLAILFKEDAELLFLDIGACTVEDSILYANQFPKAKIIAFEPLPENLELIEQHLKTANKETSIQVEGFALSDEEGYLDFYVSGGSPYKGEDIVNTTIRPKEWNKSSSLLKPSQLMNEAVPWLTFKEKITVETRRLDTYLTQHKIREVDFMHMDVQGAELKVLIGLGHLLKNVKAIWLEVENVALYEHQPLRQDITRYLSQHNFYLVKNTSYGKMGGDCLFVNSFSLFLKYKFLKAIQTAKTQINLLREKCGSRIHSKMLEL